MFLGIIAVIIFLSILVLVHELGHFLTAKKFGLLIEEFGFGLPPRIWGKKIGETIYSINALPFGGFVKIFGEDKEDILETDENKKERGFNSLKIWKRTVIIFAGVAMNFLLAWFVISAIFMVGVPQAILITEVKADSPAFIAGLKLEDRVISATADSQKLERNELSASGFVDFVNKNQGGEIILKVERGEQVLDIKATPRINPPSNEGALGIGLVEAGLPKMGFFTSFWEGLKMSVNIVGAIFAALYDFFTKIFIGRANFEQVTGPVGIVKITNQAGEMGFVYLLQLLALISLNLAVINIFPFPALDGGRLLFLLIEKIKGSPLPVRFERYANAIGMGLLLFLMLLITIKDIIRF